MCGTPRASRATVTGPSTGTPVCVPSACATPDRDAHATRPAYNATSRTTKPTSAPAASATRRAKRRTPRFIALFLSGSLARSYGALPDFRYVGARSPAVRSSPQRRWRARHDRFSGYLSAFGARCARSGRPGPAAEEGPRPRRGALAVRLSRLGRAPWQAQFGSLPSARRLRPAGRATVGAERCLRFARLYGRLPAYALRPITRAQGTSVRTSPGSFRLFK